MGPIVGRFVAELVTDGKPSLDLRPFRFSRFAQGAVGRPRALTDDALHRLAGYFLAAVSVRARAAARAVTGP